MLDRGHVDAVLANDLVTTAALAALGISPQRFRSHPHSHHPVGVSSSATFLA